MIAVIDYDTGNLCSVANALRRLGVEYRITYSPNEIRNADRVLLPGVGEASSAMQKLRERNLVEVIRSLTQPILGICIGAQLLCLSSEEGDTECIGIFDNRVRKLDALCVETKSTSCSFDSTLIEPVPPIGNSSSSGGTDVIRGIPITERLKVPHMGWNSIEHLRSELFTGVEEGSYVYYVHSFAPEVNADTIATTTYGIPFSAAIHKDNFYGTQFHPEKSAAIGERILSNFLAL